MTEKAISILEDLHLIEKKDGNYDIRIDSVFRLYTTTVITLLNYLTTLDEEQFTSWYKEHRKNFDNDETTFVTIVYTGITAFTPFIKEKLDNETAHSLTAMLHDMYRTLQEQEKVSINFIKAVNQAFRVLIDALYMVV